MNEIKEFMKRKMSEVKEFTINSPTCPKCGHETRRQYHWHGQYRDNLTVLEFLDEGEYFIVTCQDCHYQFAQKTKEEK